jgi:hypothetical protein
MIDGGLLPQMRVTPAGEGEIARMRKEGRNGPNEYKRELAGSPQYDRALKRLGPIGGLLQGLELGSKPSAAQRKKWCEESGVGSRPKRLAHRRRLPPSVEEFRWHGSDGFCQAGCIKGQDRRCRGSAEWR